MTFSHSPRCFPGYNNAVTFIDRRPVSVVSAGVYFKPVSFTVFRKHRV